MARSRNQLYFSYQAIVLNGTERFPHLWQAERL
jgi:hypothetical protein